jgi:hypothetical protein
MRGFVFVAVQTFTTAFFSGYNPRVDKGAFDEGLVFVAVQAAAPVPARSIGGVPRTAATTRTTATQEIDAPRPYDRNGGVELADDVQPIDDAANDDVVLIEPARRRNFRCLCSGRRRRRRRGGPASGINGETESTFAAPADRNNAGSVVPEPFPIVLVFFLSLFVSFGEGGILAGHEFPHDGADVHVLVGAAATRCCSGATRPRNPHSPCRPCTPCWLRAAPSPGSAARGADTVPADPMATAAV